MQHSFVFSRQAITRFRQRVPTYERQRAVRRFIVEEYQCETSFDQLGDVPADNMVFPFTLSDEAIATINRVVQNAHEAGFSNVSRSSVMRDVIDVMNRRGLPGASKTASKRQTIQVEKTVIESISRAVPRGERNATIEQFILEAYRPSPDPDVLKQKPAGKREVLLELDQRAFAILDQYVQGLGIKGLSRAALFRDVLRQLHNRFEKHNPRQKALEQQLQHVLSEYQSVAKEAVIRETVEKYLTASRRETE